MSSPSSLPLPPERQILEPWRCSCCKELMYNRDENGNPTEGAPMPKFWSIKYQQVCSMCYEMACAANTPYMMDVQEKEMIAEQLRKEKINRLSGRDDSSTGWPY